MRLTSEREKEIRALDRYDFCGRDMYEAFTQLLAEIDALREELIKANDQIILRQWIIDLKNSPNFDPIK